jgi:hypothetical protein
MKPEQSDEHIFSGTIYLIYAFDMGDDINLEAVARSPHTHTISRDWPKYLKSYHKPLSIELPSSAQGNKAMYANLHHYGAVSVVYQIPFKGTLDSLRNKLNDLDAQYQEQSIQDAHKLYHKIKKHIAQPNFFHQKNSYLVMAIDPQTEVPAKKLREEYGSLIASTLRFEKTNISQFQVEDILESATGYYRNDLVIIDTEAAFAYDHQADELLDFFELAITQQLELRYFDNLLNSKLDEVYNRTIKKPSFRNCLPFIGTMYDPIGELSQLKVDISVITERLGSAIKTVGEVYYSEIYDLLSEKLELNVLRSSVEKKLAIVRDVRTIYQTKVNSIREDLLSVLIIILIFIELLVALFK